MNDSNVSAMLSSSSLAGVLVAGRWWLVGVVVVAGVYAAPAGGFAREHVAADGDGVADRQRPQRDGDLSGRARWIAATAGFADGSGWWDATKAASAHGCAGSRLSPPSTAMVTDIWRAPMQ
jgi:hypothetical protein